MGQEQGEKKTNQERSEDLTNEANELLEESQERDVDLDPATMNKLLDLFNRAMILDHKNISAYLGVAFLHGLQENFGLAHDFLNRAQSIWPDDPRITEMMKELQDMQNPSNQTQDPLPNNSNNNNTTTTTTTSTASTKPQKVALLAEGMLTKEFFDALTMVFKYYDQDNNGAWSKQELGKFYQQVNQEPLDQDTVTYLQTHFDTNSKGELTIQGFMEFYSAQSNSFEGEKETRKDFVRLGFNDQLQPVDDRYAKPKSKPEEDKKKEEKNNKQ